MDSVSLVHHGHRDTVQKVIITLTACRPPLQEGHHVTSGLRDIAGGRDANQDLERDCKYPFTMSNRRAREPELIQIVALVRTPSASSTESSRTHSTKSDIRNPSSSNLNLARAPSATISQPRPQYKTYDHHLLSPEDARFRPKDGNLDLGAQSPINSGSTQQQSVTPTTGNTTASGSTATPTSGSASTASPTRSMFRLNHRHHHHHHRHLHTTDHRTKVNGITELSPESVIEHIFNPYESHEDSPFTYVAPPRQPVLMESPPALRDDEEHHEHAPPSGEGGEGMKNRLGGWRRKTKEGLGMSRTASGIGSVGIAAAASAGGGGGGDGAGGAGTGGGGGMNHSHSFVGQPGNNVGGGGMSRSRAATGTGTGAAPIRA